MSALRWFSRSLSVMINVKVVAENKIRSEHLLSTMYPKIDKLSIHLLPHHRVTVHSSSLKTPNAV